MFKRVVHMAGHQRRGEQTTDHDPTLYLPIMSRVGPRNQGGLEVDHAVGRILEGESGTGQVGSGERRDEPAL
jgi:hypothetical protein